MFQIQDFNSPVVIVAVGEFVVVVVVVVSGAEIFIYYCHEFSIKKIIGFK